MFFSVYSFGVLGAFFFLLLLFVVSFWLAFFLFSFCAFVAFSLSLCFWCSLAFAAVVFSGVFCLPPGVVLCYMHGSE